MKLVENDTEYRSAEKWRTLFTLMPNAVEVPPPPPMTDLDDLYPEPFESFEYLLIDNSGHTEPRTDFRVATEILKKYGADATHYMLESHQYGVNLLIKFNDQRDVDEIRQESVQLERSLRREVISPDLAYARRTPGGSRR